MSDTYLDIKNLCAKVALNSYLNCIDERAAMPWYKRPFAKSCGDNIKETWNRCTVGLIECRDKCSKAPAKIDK